MQKTAIGSLCVHAVTSDRHANRLPAQMMRVMRLLTFLLFAACLSASASVTAQSVTISGKALTYEQVFAAIKKQTGYVVMYDQELLSDKKTFSLSVTNLPLSGLLRMILKDQPLKYEIADKTIFISRKSNVEFIPAPPPEKVAPPVTGVVRRQDGRPLPGATVKIKGSARGVSTDENGRFSLEVESGQALVISYTGYQEQEVKVRSSDVLTIVLALADSKLEEIQIIAYGQTTRRFQTGSVSTVKAADIERQPVGNVFNALKGLVPGLDIVQRTGTPGSPIRLNIRGLNSLTGANEPFVLVDGVPFASTSFSAGRNSTLGAFGEVSAFNAINPNDIERIEFLKDADATAIYGSRGANGVILITTKKGKPGKTEVNLNVYRGFGQISRRMELLNTRQYLDMRYEAFANDNIDWRANSIVAHDLKSWDTTRYTNWQDVLIGGTAQYTNAQLSLSGGNQLTNFSVSGNYFKETTVYPGDFGNYKASFRTSLNHKSVDDRLRIGVGALFTFDFNKLPSTSPMDIALPPVAPEIYDANGNLNWEGGTWTNPLAVMQRTTEYATHNLNLSSQISYRLFKNFHLKTDIGLNKIDHDNVGLEPLISLNPFAANPQNSAYVIKSAATSWNIEPYLEYGQDIWKGKLTALFGGTFQQRKNESTIIQSTNFVSDALLRTPEAAQSYVLTSSNSLYRYNSVFGRLNYNLYGRYILNLTARRDGSSRFGPGRQFGNFGAVGLAWIFSEESFVKERLPFLSFGKLRSSYGVTGSDAIGDYAYLSTYSSSFYQSYFGGTAFKPDRLFNPEYAWESNRKADVALELGFKNDDILFSVNYYNNRSSNQLVGLPMPAMVGFSSVNGNLNATVLNAGWEFALNLIALRNSDFEWRSSANLTIPRTKLVSYPDLETSTHANTYRIGQSLSLVRAYDFVGVNPQTGVNVFRDRNGKDTSFITSIFFGQPDRVAMINQVPHFYGGINNTFSYRNFSLDVLFQYAQRTRNTNLAVYYGVPGAATNVPLYVYENSWRQPGDITLFQKFTQATNTPAYRSRITSNIDSHYGVVNFLRLSNASLSWRLPAPWLQKVRAKSARIYMQGQNLFTFTDFKGEDPEAGSTALPVLRVVTMGAQINF